MTMTISHEREPLADRVVCNVPERGAAIAGNSREGVLLLTREGVRLMTADSP